jgi:hypothetical protein
MKQMMLFYSNKPYQNVQPKYSTPKMKTDEINKKKIQKLTKKIKLYQAITLEQYKQKIQQYNQLVKLINNNNNNNNNNKLSKIIEKKYNENSNAKELFSFKFDTNFLNPEIKKRKQYTEEQNDLYKKEQEQKIIEYLEKAIQIYQTQMDIFNKLNHKFEKLQSLDPKHNKSSDKLDFKSSNKSSDKFKKNDLEFFSKANLTFSPKDN